MATFAGFAASSADSASCGSGVTGSGSSCDCPVYPYLSVPDRLYGVAGSSASDVWAVGLQPTSSLIMHWDGCAWSVAYNRPVGYFYGVSTTSSTDAWAVGGTSWWTPSHTLAEHWNGRSWSHVSTPTYGSSALFQGVAATSATNAWAVGLIGPAPGNQLPSSTYEPLIDRWNGSSWSVQSVPRPSPGAQFGAVAATSADDAWAVGWTGDAHYTLIDHWNGSTWTRVPSPNPGGAHNALHGVTVISADDAWAVGTTEATEGGSASTLTLHWDGSTWSVVSSPTPAGDTSLQAVSAASANDVWATGYSNPTTCGHGGPMCQGVIMHWDGTSWTVTSSPNPSGGYLNDYLGVFALAGDDAWAVGTHNWSSTLIANWDGSGWH